MSRRLLIQRVLGWSTTADCPRCGRTCHFPDNEGLDNGQWHLVFHCNWCDIDFDVWD